MNNTPLLNENEYRLPLKYSYHQLIILYRHIGAYPSCCQPSSKIESGLVHDAGRVAAAVPPLPVPRAEKEFGGTLQSLDHAMI